MCCNGGPRTALAAVELLTTTVEGRTENGRQYKKCTKKTRNKKRKEGKHQSASSKT